MGVLIGDEQDIDFAGAAATKQATGIRPEAVFTRQAKAVTGDNKLLMDNDFPILPINTILYQ